MREVLPVALPVPQAVPPPPAARLPLGVALAQGVGERVPVGQAVREGEGLWLGVELTLLLALWLLLAETVLLSEAALLAVGHRVEVKVRLPVGEVEAVSLLLALGVPVAVGQKLSVEDRADVEEALGLVVRVALLQRLGLPVELRVPVGQKEGVGEPAGVPERLALPPVPLALRGAVRVTELHPELLVEAEAVGTSLGEREAVWLLLPVAVAAAGEPVALRVPVGQKEGVGVPASVTDRLALPPVPLALSVEVRVPELHPELLPMAEAVGRVLGEREAVWQLLPDTVPAAGVPVPACGVPVLLVLSHLERMLPAEALAALLEVWLTLEQPEAATVAVTHLVAALLLLTLKDRLSVAVREVVGQSVLERDGVALCDTVGLLLAWLAEETPEAEGWEEEEGLGVWLRGYTTLRALLRVSATAKPPPPLLSTLTPPGL